MSSTLPVWTPVSRLWSRYDLLEELPQGTGGRLFRARDLAFAENVALKFFDAEHRIQPEHRDELEAVVRRLQSLPHPHLCHVYSINATGGLLVREWIQGVSLLDLLRKRRSLTFAEVTSILGALPSTLDFLARENAPVPPDLLRKLFIRFDGAAPTDSILTGAVARWPRFVLKLNALNLRSWMAARSVEDTTHFILARSDSHDADATHEARGPRNLARLIYELLGGRIMELHSGRYSPIGVLGETGNAVLRRALFEMPPPSCQTLWEDILTAQPGSQSGLRPQSAHTSADRLLQIPPPLLASAAQGALLDLVPADRQTTPIRLVARKRFTIGRSLQQADFATRIHPENEANHALTNRLSRIHVFLSRDGSSMEARDGNGCGPSLNGSRLNGEPLALDRPATITCRSLLWLGAEYAMELIPLAGSPSFQISNIASWSGPKSSSSQGELRGALACLPKDGQPAARHTAWLFTEIGFGLDASDDLVWDTRGRSSSPASFHYHDGQFWLSNRSLAAGALACGDTPLHRDEIAPLVPGQVVRMGSRTYTVNLE